MGQSLVSRFERRCVVGLALLCSAAALPAQPLALEDLLAAPTPLILKDGRIAYVSVHTIPFGTGAAELDEADAAELRALLQPLATDCFLTAQAIGHVRPGAGRDGDTLDAHRLARARADHVQGTLAALGMPLAAVASVWDWQFLVEESRVTLWVFRLNVGDDCEGTALPAGPPVVASGAAESPTEAMPPTEVAAAEPPAVAADPQPVVTAAAAPRELRTDEPASAAPAASVAGAVNSSAAPATETVVITTSGMAAATDEEASAAALDAIATSEPSSVGGSALEPEPQPEPATLAAAEPAPEFATTAATEAAPTLAITFDVNSSFFPPTAGGELRRFLAGLPADAAIEIELAGAVGTGDVRAADPEEAKRYNAWMAERRVQRVAEWLTKNARERRLTLTEQLVDGDPSRQVRLRARFLP